MKDAVCGCISDEFESRDRCISVQGILKRHVVVSVLVYDFEFREEGPEGVDLELNFCPQCGEEYKEKKDA